MKQLSAHIGHAKIDQMAYRGRFERFRNHEIRPAILRQFERIEIIQPRAARHRNNTQIRIIFTQMQDCFNPFLIRHDDIHQHRIVSAAARIDALHGFAAIHRLLDKISGARKDMPQRKTHLRIVIRDKNYFLFIRHLLIVTRKTYPPVKKDVMPCRCAF